MTSAPLISEAPASLEEAPRALAALLARRRSVRHLHGGPLPPEMAARLLAAAAMTPAAYNQPPWRIVLVDAERAALWAEIAAGFRTALTGERRERYLQRLEGFSGGVAVALVFVDLAVAQELETERGLSAEVAHSFVEQALGMVQLALWLAIAAEGLVTSLQHWDHLVGPRLARFAALPETRFRLVATMPIGYETG